MPSPGLRRTAGASAEAGQADVVPALTETEAFCDSVSMKLTDGSGQEISIVDRFGGEKRTRFSVLTLGDEPWL